MGGQGYFLFRGDKTVCGGRILEGFTDHQFFDKDMACEGHKVTCGKHPGHYRFAAGLKTTYMVKELPERYTAIVPAPASRSSFLQIGMIITNWVENQQ